MIIQLNNRAKCEHLHEITSKPRRMQVGVSNYSLANFSLQSRRVQ
jgi:hypothetical protein